MVHNRSATYGKFKVQKTISQYGPIIFPLEQLDMWVFFKNSYTGELEVGIFFTYSTLRDSLESKYLLQLTK